LAIFTAYSAKSMRLIILTVFFAPVFLILASCEPENQACFKSSGPADEVRFDTEAFSSIAVNDYFELVLVPQSEYYVCIRAGKNLIPFVDWEVNSHCLSISNKNRCTWLRKYEPIEIEIGFNELSEISLYQSASLTNIDTITASWFSVDNHTGFSNISLCLRCDSLFFRVHASTGDYRLSGSSEYAYVYNRGTGFLYADSMHVNRMHLVHMSTGKSRVQVENLLMIEKIVHGKVYSLLCPYIATSDTASLQLLVKEGC